MSIPRAKITIEPGGFFVIACTEHACPWCGCIRGAYALPVAVPAALTHLCEAHGVRTVGSLTANDIGKWIEVDVRDGKNVTTYSGVIREIQHRGTQWTGVAIPVTWLHFPNDTPCRVTEERS